MKTLLSSAVLAGYIFLVANGQNAIPQRCSVKCTDAGIDPGNWTVYHDINRLTACNETMLLDFNLYNPLDDPKTHASIRSCTAGGNTASSGPASSRLRRDGSCVSESTETQVAATLELAWLKSGDQGNAAEVIAAAQQIQTYLSELGPSCNTTPIVFGYSGAATVGLYAGSRLHGQGVDLSAIQKFIVEIENQGISDTVLVQLCDAKDRGSDFAMGIIANANSSISFVQSVVKTWNDGECFTAVDGSTAWQNITFWAPNPLVVANNSTFAPSFTEIAAISSTASGGAPSSSIAEAAVSSAPARRAAPIVVPRATCSTIQVVSGDSCGSLATKCKITGAQFTTYNPSSTLCSTLAVGEHVCCSAGTLPSFAPTPNPDGSCFAYSVVSGDYCAKIAATYSVTVANMEIWNKNTWGWMSCNDLQAGMKMCLSTGTPPMPAPVVGTVCGPQVPGTKPPAAGTSLGSLNPCKLNACCDIWGQCGTTDEFCTLLASVTGAPGTAAAGTNGCISNCGDAIIIGSAPAVFRKIAYWESWSADRGCLDMLVTEIDNTVYTHVHFAFAAITPAFAVDVSDVAGQFSSFVGMTGVKRILSFGGWSFSTSQDTSPIFGSGVTAANRATFVANVVAFVQQYSLDGVDFDWEYPGATDIPGLVGSPNDGANYLAFLTALRAALPKGVSISIAAPASFWYLQGFPIALISAQVDYIVYMTYDLHGQWDYGNAFTDPSCPSGNCLRSHVNLTETINALSMITKAGVPSNQVVVGVASYGRSFQMTTAGCTSEMCTYTGPASGAAPGECTQTAGYISNAEINDIIAGIGVTGVSTWQDPSDSNLVVYNGNQWISYMSDGLKAQRTALYQQYHVGGTSDWAVDLQSYSYPDILWAQCTNEGTYPTIDSIIADTSIPSNCMNLYIIGAYVSTISTSLATYNSILANGYDTKFNLYAQQVSAQVHEQLNDFYTNHLDSFFSCIYSVPQGSGFVNQTAPGCPPGYIGGHEYNTYLVPNDPTLASFYNFVQTTYSIDSSLIAFTTFQYGTCIPPQDCSTFGNLIGLPDVIPNIPNPKSTIQNGLTNLTSLSNFLTDTELQISAGLFGGDDSDVVDSASIPVFMVESAITSMQNVVQVGTTIQKDQRKNLILDFILGFLMIIPGLGEAALAIDGFALIGKIIEAVGVAGNAAFSVYGVVEQPKSAPLAIFGILLGAAATRTEEGFAAAALVRRGMSATDIGNLGADISAGLTKVAKVVRYCG